MGVISDVVTLLAGHGIRAHSSRVPPNSTHQISLAEESGPQIVPHHLERTLSDEHTNRPAKTDSFTDELGGSSTTLHDLIPIYLHPASNQ